MTYAIAIAFVAILAALACAGVFMMRGNREGQPKSANMMRALAVRVALSVTLFACVMLAWWAGWIHPTGLPIGR